MPRYGPPESKEKAFPVVSTSVHASCFYYIFCAFWTILNKVTLLPSASAAGPLLLCSTPDADASVFTDAGVLRDLTILTGAKSGLCIGENEEEEEEEAVLEIRTSDKITETFAGGTIVIVCVPPKKNPSPELDTEYRNYFTR